MVTLGLCMIVKNEEDVLENCLNSCKNLFDEIVICDTGSSDGTKLIASKYATKVLDFKWNYNFSDARNFSILNCSCDYFMWLDADDEITAENLQKLLVLKKNLESEKPNCVFIKYNTNFDENGKVTFSYFRERILKNDKINLFIDPVHEVIVPREKIVYCENISIEHRKSLKQKILKEKEKFLTNNDEKKHIDVNFCENCEENENFSKKSENLTKNDEKFTKNEQILTKKEQKNREKAIKLLEKEKKKAKTRNLEIYERQNKKEFSPRQMFYYARELMNNEKFSKAVFWFKKFLKQKNSFVENRIETCLNLSEIYLALNEIYLAKQILFESFCFDLPRAEILCKIGEIYMYEKDFEKAIYYFKMASFCKKNEKSLAFVSSDCYDFVPFIQMCVCYFNLGDIDKALYYNTLAKNVKPKSEIVINNEKYLNFLTSKSVAKPLS